MTEAELDLIIELARCAMLVGLESSLIFASLTETQLRTFPGILPGPFC